MMSRFPVCWKVIKGTIKSTCSSGIKEVRLIVHHFLANYWSPELELGQIQNFLKLYEGWSRLLKKAKPHLFFSDENKESEHSLEENYSRFLFWVACYGRRPLFPLLAMGPDKIKLKLNFSARILGDLSQHFPNKALTFLLPVLSVTET